MALRPYPTSLDAAVWTELLAVIEGTKKPDAHSLHCVEDGLAFGMGQAFPDPPNAAPMVSHSGPASPMTAAQAGGLCKKMIAAGGAASAHATSMPAGMTWVQWIAFILQLLQGLVPILGGIGAAGS